ncbi:photosystem II S4 domain protein [Cyanobium sp. FACHB-13342]|uniref:photosystem II S4 domain protein n=1 Tax=Cyanobium sp. FACHB-13342 TaxID=2692793 RepID=UPI00167FF2AE|nr:photosystem II S4 domain protein [Cyanobium sp. FACHB-13342]MBD2423534.1 photosystem II S4 domain protein [Cyanobium sp. FACHB-13342]
MLPQRDLLVGSQHPTELAAVLAAADQALRTWEPVWTGFVDGGVREEASERFGALAELTLTSTGGYPGAERQRLLVQRQDAALDLEDGTAGLMGLEISGNFLFDPAERTDFRAGLLALGLAEGALGDIWVRGDRGAQAVVTAQQAAALDGRTTRVRTVEVRLEARPLDQLQLPAPRQPRRFQTVEASLRLDAVASAGFGISRNRMAELIRQGSVRVNWQTISSPSRLLVAGDRVQLEGRGELRLEAVQATKRERWRIELVRC